MNKPTKTTMRKQRGFSVIEVLIALFVFAIGILTVAGLQIVSKRTNYEAVQRTTATFLAYDIIERMRANPAELGIYVDDALGAFRPNPMNCRNFGCSTDQLAEFDVWEWQQALLGVAETVNNNSAGGLLNPAGCISGPAVGGEGIYTITITWQGVDELTNINESTCGAQYQNADEYGANFEYRRLVQISTFIAP